MEFQLRESVEKKFAPVFEMLRGSTIRGIVFSVYDKFGPQTLYSFPFPVEQEKDGFGLNREERIKEKVTRLQSINTNTKGAIETQQSIQDFTQRDYLQITIKSVSLLIGEKIFQKDKSLLNTNFFGVLPYPDLDVCADTFFCFYSDIFSDEPKSCTFSLLIDNNKRAYIYDNISFLRIIITETVKKLITLIKSGKWSVEEADEATLAEVDNVILDFFMQLKLADERKVTPITSKRQIKIIFAGLKNSGKTSFLLTINRKYSELIRRDSPQSAEIHIANMLGTTIINWDLPFIEKEKDFGKSDLTKFKTQADINLLDADLVYYFIDPIDSQHWEQNSKWFNMILQHLKQNNLNIPIFTIISKIDVDLANRPEIREIISKVQENLSLIARQYMFNFRFFETSIFDLVSVLRAFSSGINLLSPNKEIIDYKLHEYAKILDSSAILLLNENGLLIYDIAQDPEYDVKHDFGLKYALETLAPQYIDIYRNFDAERTPLVNDQDVNKMQINPNQKQQSSNIMFKTKLNDNKYLLLKKIQISASFFIYIFLYMNEKTIKSPDLESNMRKLGEDLKEILALYVL
jgi:GTPase SAR1 family protein